MRRTTTTLHALIPAFHVVESQELASSMLRAPITSYVFGGESARPSLSYTSERTMHQVKDIMTDDTVVVGPENTIDEAISLLLDHRVSGLPVVDDEGLLMGVISEIDIIDLVYETEIDASTVRDHMTRDVRSLDIEASLDEAASVFCKESVRRIPILQDGRLVGILSRRDLIRFVREVRKQANVS